MAVVPPDHAADAVAGSLAAAQVELAQVTDRLREAEETLRALRQGEVDALVVSDGAPGEQVFTLSSADRPYRIFVENMRDGAATLSESGVVLYVNRRVAEMLSVAGPAIVGTPIASWVADHDHDLLAALLRPSAIGGTAQVTLVNPHGRRVEVLLGTARLTVGTDDLVCLTIADVTARRVTEEATARLAAIVDFSDDAIYSATLEGRVTTWNAAAARMYGYSAEHMIGRSAMLLAPPDRRHELPLLIDRLATGVRVEQFETVRVARDGHPLPVSQTVSAIRDLSSTMVGVSIIARDITESRRTHEAHEAMRRRTETVIATARDPFVGMDESGVVTDWNASAEKTFGWSREGALGSPLEKLIMPPRRRASYRAWLKRISDADEPASAESTVELAAVHRDGSPRAVEIAIWRTGSGARREYSAIIRDISQRKQIEQALGVARDKALEASRLKSAFLATLSHEIRTPMNGVIGLTVLLLASELTPRQRRYAGGIQSAGDALLVVMNDILDFSKIEAGHIALEEVTFDPADIVEEVAGLVGATARQKGLSVRGESHPALATAVRGDPGRLRQVLLNLATNAVKFTEHGAVTLSATPTAAPSGGQVTVLDGGSGSSPDDALNDEVPDAPGEGPGDLPEGAPGSAAWPGSSRLAGIRFEVRDSGIGVPLDDAVRIFEPFTQADASTTRRYGGTGLGLAISRQLVGAMGGRIGVESVEGEGSTFWCWLPLQPASPGAKLAPSNLPLATADVARLRAGTPAGGVTDRDLGRVLLVEDNAINQMVAVGLLDALGYQVDIAANGQEAVERTAGRAYQAVLMDCRMPVMDGYAATRELRRREGGGRRTPIIAMTASALPEDEQRCLAADMDDYLCKPVRPVDLETVLARWVVPVDPRPAVLAHGRAGPIGGRSADGVSRSAPGTAAPRRVSVPHQSAREPTMIDSTGNDGLLGGADEGLDDSAELVGRSDAEADAVASGAGGTVGEDAVRDTDPAAAGTDDVDADIAASGGDPSRS